VRFASLGAALGRAADGATAGWPAPIAAHWLKVESRVMTAVRYHRPAQQLDIRFTNGRTYRYSKVPLTVYDGLLDADSKGRFFNEAIKDAFDYSEIRLDEKVDRS
jgi:hypothetical protein